jgi:hypothetical protein
MSKTNTNLEDEGKLERLIGKSEVLVERHQEELDELEDSESELEGWISIIFKTIKSVLLH